MMKSDEFRIKLQADYGYRTPDVAGKRLWYRLFGRFDFTYNAAMLAIIIKGARLYRSGKWDRAGWLDLSLDVMRCVEGCGGRIDVSGCEHLAAVQGPSVIVANHMSVLETFGLPCLALPFSDLTFVVKESLTRMPFMRDVMNGSKPISVGRSNPRADLKKLMELGPKTLEQGRSVVIFPQATRDPIFRPSMFNTLGMKLAKRAGVPLVPLALKTDFHGLGRTFKDFGPVDRSKTVFFKFGEAIPILGNGRDAHDASVRFISETLQSWGGSVEVDT